MFELGAGHGNKFSMAEFVVNRAIVLRKSAEFFDSQELASGDRHRSDYGPSSLPYLLPINKNAISMSRMTTTASSRKNGVPDGIH